VTTDDHRTSTRLPRGLSLGLPAGALLAAVGALWVAAGVFRTATLLPVAAVASVALLGAAAWYVRKLVVWRAGGWIGPYLLERRHRFDDGAPLDVCFQFIDHFEPDHGRAGPQRQIDRVRRWEQAYAAGARGHTDSDGRCPQHTWFFAISENTPEAAAAISRWPGKGWGEIEYHIHHDAQMTEEQLRARIGGDVAQLQQIGAASAGRYGFVHGMFALAGGDPRWCSITGEIDVLLETGCYADFTFGSVGTPAQPRQVNTIYYARSTGRPKPYDTGTECTVGRKGDGLLMIPGPMCFGLFPRALDDAHVEPHHLPHPRRIARWLDAHVHVRGRPNWVFISVHSHTAREDARDALFTGPMQRLWGELERRFKTGTARLHYLTAREAYNVVKAAEADLRGSPGDYRDFEIPPPANRKASLDAGAPGPGETIG